MARKHSLGRAILLGSLMASLALAGAAMAGDGVPTLSSPDNARLSLGDFSVPAGVVGAAKADGDTIYLLGGPDAVDGRFETSEGLPSWQGWTTEDFTYDGTMAWNISSDPDHVIDGAHTMVCGILWEFDDGTSDFGYGNGWYKQLIFSGDVPDPNASTQLRLTGVIRIDTETDYDYVYLEVRTASGWVQFPGGSQWDDVLDRPTDIDFSMTLDPGDYGGANGDQVMIRWYFISDTGWSDEDGNWDSDGAAQLDNLSVYTNGNLLDYEDFEDEVSDHWIEAPSDGVGDYAYLYANLLDVDPCRENRSYQVAFVDDGMVVPGTGGSNCISWCYGPGGYVVNHTGGLLGTSAHIQNGIQSPVLAWPEGCDAARLGFGVYRHEELLPTSTGVFYRWFVRSTTSSDPADIENTLWNTDNSYYYGTSYFDGPQSLTSYLEPGRQYVQVMLMTHEFGWYWGIEGDDGTPAPYFDNVRVLAYPYGGPAFSYDALFLAQDSFPEQGDLDFVNLGSNHIRFDNCYNIAPAGDLVADAGDSLSLTCVPVRTGSTLMGPPQMKVRMKANPLFDPYRALPAGFSQSGGIITGSVLGLETFDTNGNLVEDVYNFDLPDTGFFYPGDVIHSYFEARDNVGGDIGLTLLPGDTAGYASFEHDLTYPSDFICRGLPSLHSANIDDQPKILFWNDFGNRGGENEWYWALKGCGLVEGQGYDIYYTARPDAGEYNGLGSRATSAVLDGYEILLYTCGDLLGASLGDGVLATEPSPDVQVIDAWLDRGDKKALFTGDDLVSDLVGKTSEAVALVNEYFGVELIHHNLQDFVSQTAPLVQAFTDNGVVESVDRWIAYGGCLGINTFDAVETRGTAVRLAEFTDQNGNGGVYDYAAAVYHHNEVSNAEVIYLPYDFMFVYNAPGYVPPGEIGVISARAIMLRDILNFFGQQLPGPIGVDDVPSLGKVEVSAYPNPFNPQTTIELNLPRQGRVAVKIFSVRGELVRTLHDGVLPAGVHELVWDGRDDRGAASASGVYFAETRALDQTRVVRMAMVK
jgi:hypothetical protein